jgi:hypothetical protein
MSRGQSYQDDPDLNAGARNVPFVTRARWRESKIRYFLSHNFGCIFDLYAHASDNWDVSGNRSGAGIEVSRRRT